MLTKTTTTSMLQRGRAHGGAETGRPRRELWDMT